MDAELAEQLNIKVVTPNHEEWKERRSRWNLFSEDEAEVRIILVPQNQDEVVKIVNSARKHNQTDVGVRSGGHGFFSAAAVVVDMRDGFNYASVDEETGVATIGMGQTLGELDEKTHPYHVPVGVVSHTGCGLLCTGGVGYLCKAYGTSADNIVEVTIVTSDGVVHTCSRNVEPDLFFAVRGAAPNLGIVIELKTKCYRHPDALCTLKAWPCSFDNVKRLVDWADQDAVLHDTNMTVYLALLPTPDMSAHICALHVVCIGLDDVKYRDLIGQLEGTDDMMDLLPTSRVPFSTPQTIFDDSFPSMYWYVSQSHFPFDAPLDDEGLKAVVETFRDTPLNPSYPMVIYEQRGSTTSSKYHAFDSDSCAQPRYGQRWECYIFYGTNEKENAELIRNQGRAMKETISQYAQSGGRCHFTKDEPGRIDYYYGPNTNKVKETVNKYDPHRLFAKCNGMEF